MSEFWGSKTFCVVTGGSRGLGRSIAAEFSKRISPGSTLILLARTLPATDDTKGEILRVNPNCKVLGLGMDLMNPDIPKFEATLQKAVGDATSTFDQCVLVHCAGTTGDCTNRTVQYTNFSEIQYFFNLEVTSMLLLTSSFVKFFQGYAKHTTVIQLTTELTPFPRGGVYCAAKAARDSLMRSIALEEGEAVRTLSFNPGSCDTGMMDDAIASCTDQPTRQVLLDMKNSGKLLKPEVPVGKLVQILETNGFISGQHFDYEVVKD
ncbi:sepiapterin reductase [Folsomia candida]|uniref:Sepiapterin reductase n=1 Tax=Folsomia candida TaxID=158441 RepID=A0A226DVQ7_FOLCA|nr:sepiapterin reductase [Folsomia candida]OXA49542.1 Sepiapterin reductase [Folsomia candida]